MAFEWFLKSAEQGNTKAQNDLALCFRSGKGVEENPQKAVEWITKAAEQGLAVAQYNLAMWYAGNYGGLTRDLDKIIEWCSKAAAQGYEEAVRLLEELKKIGM